MKLRHALLPLALATLAATPAHADNAYGVYITEWMYKGVGPNDGLGEFIEFTNTGTTAVDLTGWSYDDDSNIPLSTRLSSFGLLQAGESIILTEIGAEDFRVRWGLDASVRILGGYSNNLGNGDQINLYDASQSLVDRLTYGTSPRTLGRSGHATSFATLGDNLVSGWVLSSTGDIEGSWTAASGDIGSPGTTSFTTPVPEPLSLAMLAAGLGAVGVVRRRKA